MASADRELGSHGGRSSSRESQAGMSLCWRRIRRWALIVLPLVSAGSARRASGKAARRFWQSHPRVERTGPYRSAAGYGLRCRRQIPSVGGMDRVVHVWEFRDGQPRLEWTIRPPMGRSTGRVYALAISQVGDRRLVAVAGRSAFDPYGQILVYRLPPANRAGAVEHVVRGSLTGYRRGDDLRAHNGEVFRIIVFSPRQLSRLMR